MSTILAEACCSSVPRPRLRALLETWLARERSRKHLAALDDRMLADVGLSRDDVQAEVRKPFWLS